MIDTRRLKLVSGILVMFLITITLIVYVSEACTVINEDIKSIYKPEDISFSLLTNKPEEAEVGKAEDQEYTIQRGDTLYSICERFYSNGNYCFALANYNKITNSWLIFPGQKIVLPGLENDEFIKQEEYVKEYNTSSYQAPTYPISAKNNTGNIDTSGLQYIGVYKITGYTPTCAHCCGKSNGITASGARAIVGRTIAMKGYPFGTTVYIEGYGFYVIEDTGGFKPSTIDIAAASHNEAYTLTNRGVNVYIVP